MSLQGAVDLLSNSERARAPRSLAIEAYFDGWNQASGGPPRTFPRFLTRDEEASWREGWAEAKAERAQFGDSHQAAAGSNLVHLRARRPECAPCPLLAVAA